MKKVHILLTLAALVGCNPPAPDNGQTSVAPGEMDRTVLPIKEPSIPAITELDARKATAPAKAPNVVIVLIDDIGFGHSSAFSGPINMPTQNWVGR